MESYAATLQDSVLRLRSISRELTALLVVQLIFACNITCVRYATHYVESIVIITFRDLIATIVLNTLWYISERRKAQEFEVDADHSQSRPDTPDVRDNHEMCPSLSRREWMLLALAGGLGVCGHLYFVSLGIQLTSAVMATVFAATRPLFAAMTSAILAVDHLTPHRLVGFVFGLCGVALAVQIWHPPALHGKGSEVLLGYLCLLVSNAFYGSYLVVLKLSLRTVPLLTALSRIFLIGMVGILLIAVSRWEAFSALQFAPFGVFAVIAFGGLVVSPVPYALNAFAVGRVSPTTCAMFSNIEGPIAALLAIMFLGESVQWAQVVGFSVAAVGVMVSACGESAAHAGGEPVAPTAVDSENEFVALQNDPSETPTAVKA